MRYRGLASASGKRALDESGFTLLRLVVTIGIAGIILAIASPSIATATRVYSVRSAARQVFSDLQNTRMASVMGNQSYSFTVRDAVTYRIQSASGSFTDTSLEASGVTISAPSAITFASDGTASSTTVTVTNSSGDTMQVAVAAAGRIRVQ
jgi:type IV fimbrial biogenesis protein FimT